MNILFNIITFECIIIKRKYVDKKINTDYVEAC